MPFSGIIDKQATVTTYDSGAVSVVGRNLTGGLWKDIETNGTDPAHGMFWFDDFLTLGGSTHYTLTQQNSQGNITQGTTDTSSHGVVLIDSDDTTVGDGPDIDFGPPVTPAAGLIICAEARLKVDGTSTPPQLLVGLVEATNTDILSGDATVVVDPGAQGAGITTIDLASSAPSLTLLAWSDVDAGTATSEDSVGTLVDDTYCRIGVRFNGVTDVDFYFNGVKVATAATAMAAVVHRLRICLHSDGTTQPVAHLDWAAVGVSTL
jgi:hypothetical protein